MASKIYTFRTIIEPDRPSGYHGFVPALPGCQTGGRTVEETRRNLKEAILGILETMSAHKITIPEDQTINFIEKVEIQPVYAEVAATQSQRTR